MIVRRYDSDRTETSGYRVRHCARPLPGETVVLGIGWDVGFSTNNGRLGGTVEFGKGIQDLEEDTEL